MKRILIFLAMFLAMVLVASPTWAEWKYSGTYDIDFSNIDSSSVPDAFTDSLTGTTTGAPIFYWKSSETPAPNGVIWGNMMIRIMTRDTGAIRITYTGNTIVDTTKDTVTAILYAADYNLAAGNSTGYDRMTERALCSLIFTTHIGTTVAASTAQSFIASATVAPGTACYWRFRAAYLYTGTANNQNTQGIKYRVFLQERTPAR